MANFTPVGVEAQVKNLNGFLGDINLMGSAITGFSTAIAQAAIDAAAKLTKAVVDIGVKSVETAIEFESAFAGVIKTTDGLVDETGNLTDAGTELRQGFRDLAKEIPTTVEDLAMIGELGGQLGIGRESLLSFTETIAALGESTNLTVDEGATELAKFNNIMGTTERIGDEAFSKIGSTLVALGNNFATTERDVMNFASRIAGAGKIAGLTEWDVLGIGAAMSSVGVEAEAGGTAVQKVLLSMNQAVLQGGEQLEVFAATAGMSAVDFADAYEQSAGEAFTAFVQGLGTAGDDALNILEALELTDQRLVRSFLSLANAGPLLNNSMNLAGEAFRENNALQDEAAKRYATTESQLQILKNTVNDMGISIGETLIPFIMQLVDAARPFIEEFASKLPGLLQENVLPVLEKVGTFLAENLPVAIEIGKEAIDKIVGVFEFFKSEGPGALEAFNEKWGFVWEDIQGLVQTVVDWFQQNLPLIQETGEALVTFWEERIVPALDNVWNAIMAIVETVLGNIMSSIRIIMLLITGDFEGAWDEIKLVFFRTLNGIYNFLYETLEAIFNIFGQTWEDIKASWISVWENLKTIAVTLGGQLIEGLKTGVIDKARAFIDSVVGTVKEAWQAVVDFIKPGSPSKLFAEIGAQMGMGLATGFESVSPVMNATVLAGSATMAGAAVVGAGSTVNADVRIGPNNISGGMSQALFENRVMGVVSAALEGRQ